MFDHRSVKVAMASSLESGSGSALYRVSKVAASVDGRVVGSAGAFMTIGVVLSVEMMADRRWCKVNGKREGRFTSASLLSTIFTFRIRSLS